MAGELVRTRAEIRVPAARRRSLDLRNIGWVLPFATFLLLIFGGAILAPVIVPHDPTAQSISTRLSRPALLGGNAAYLLGSDGLGRDILSRLLVGAQASLLVGAAGVVIGSIVGTILGLIAGYFGGLVDEGITALADVQLAFPFILLAIAVVAVLGPSLPNLIIVVGLSGWVTYARVCRGAALRLRSEEYVMAVRAIGGSDLRIIWKHILPNYVPTLIVLITLDMPRLILLESTLSFLGLGIQPPTPSWGGIVSEGRQYLDSAWWIAVAPGVALLLTTLSINRVGDWLRSYLDPALKASA
ncbi:MAG: ABC transporter permease [Candidatus Limnocylindria bacterium]